MKPSKPFERSIKSDRLLDHFFSRTFVSSWPGIFCERYSLKFYADVANFSLVLHSLFTLTV